MIILIEKLLRKNDENINYSIFNIIYLKLNNLSVYIKYIKRNKTVVSLYILLNFCSFYLA